MAVPDQVIKEAVERYERERDRYIKLAARVADICRTEVVDSNAIRAQVTSRTKSVRSFSQKLERFARRKDKDMPTVQSVFDQIGDLAGVRVAAYRREDESRVTDEIRKRFRWLAASTRRELDRRYGADPTIATISLILSELPAKVPDLAERAFLSEALNCYKVKAYRAAIIMAWNLAYDHLVRWILKDQHRLEQLNSGITTRFPKKLLTIAQYDDVADIKEAELIEVCRGSKLLSKNVAAILKDKLTRRNTVAHPSRIEVTQHQADDAISDLVLNVILALP